MYWAFIHPFKATLCNLVSFFPFVSLPAPYLPVQQLASRQAFAARYHTLRRHATILKSTVKLAAEIMQAVRFSPVLDCRTLSSVNP